MMEKPSVATARYAPVSRVIGTINKLATAATIPAPSSARGNGKPSLVVSSADVYAPMP